jgi:predicted nuclease of predicted toxin-antitoxin system
MQPDWEIWLDTNISPAIAKWMGEDTGMSVKSSYSLSLHYMEDIEIYNLAKAEGNIILLSKDNDFTELISRLGAPPKLINIRFGNCSNSVLWGLIKPRIKDAITILTSSEIDIVEFQ